VGTGNPGSLKLNKKFNHDNPRVPDLFKNNLTDDYIRRHIGNKASDTQEMLKFLEVSSMSELMD
jgi:hypothetical protein